eukprot:5366385-Pleurochrysis_carterae.AAC.5
MEPYKRVKNDDTIRFNPSAPLARRHQDGLDAPARLETEDSAAVVDKVELDVAPASNLLPLLLLLCEVIILVLCDERHIGWNQRIKTVAAEREERVRVLLVKVVEEDAAQPPRLATMLDQKVLVRPLLEALVIGRIVLVAHILVGLMEMPNVLLEKVRRRQVGTAAEPPDAAVSLKVAVVEVHRWGHWVARVHDRAEAAGKERHTLARRVALSTIKLRGRAERLLRHRAVHDA